MASTENADKRRLEAGRRRLQTIAEGFTQVPERNEEQ